MKKKERSEDERAVLKDVLEDLFQDCKMDSSLSVILYLSTYFKKFFLAMFLNPQIPGILQVLLLLSVHLFQIYLIIYMVSNTLYNNKLKVITRSINLLCVICIEVMILAYNINYLSVSSMILIGVTCTYLTIIATIAGVVEILIKLMEVVFQKIAYKDKNEEI